ncbi:MAG: ribonuclease J [Anaerolineaceae bacterium]|nr:ribonuclease J [Anaerolineaceae bacterium]
MTKKNDENRIRIIPLGGLGEVGRNMTVFEYRGKYLIVDCGILFPNNNMIGVDYIIPDMQFLNGKNEQIAGVILTHGHEDHIGAVSYLFDVIEQVPIYATPLTAEMAEVKLAKGGRLSRTEVIVKQAGDCFDIGPFHIELFHMSHSIPDSVGVAIGTEAGLIVMSGDYKFDQTPIDHWPSDFAKLAELGKRGVLALLSDSTNAERPGNTPSEMEINRNFEEVFSHAKGRIIISSFASLISRLQQVSTIACQHKRKICIVGTSMVDNVNLALKLGYIDLPEESVVPLDQALSLPDKEVLILCTGSQGEETSILGRLSRGKYNAFSIRKGDTIVLSSSPIPGNEENISGVINRLYRLGADVIINSVLSVHVSGHACQEEMKLLMNLVRPKYLIPVHGELRHLVAQAKVAKTVGIPEENIIVIEDGQTVSITNGKLELDEKVPAGYVFVDGKGVGDVTADVVRQRENLSESGIMIVTLLLDKKSGGLLKEPQFVFSGVTNDDDLVQAEEQFKRQIIEHCAKVQHSRTEEQLQKEITQMVRKNFFASIDRAPWTFVNIYSL